MKINMEGKSVIVMGASGGLGSAFVRALSQRGARILLSGRNEEKLTALKDEIGKDLTIKAADITDERSVIELSEFALGWTDKIDFVINASGLDVRKALIEHSPDEIRKTIDINLYGVIILTKTLLPHMKNNKNSRIIHVGGFADGRLAFPYYSVDAASRAGVYTFIEAVNREQELEGHNTKVCYFCPSPAETEAERPYHPLWRKMGIKILSTEKVAGSLIHMLEKDNTTRIMGGAATTVFAKLNSVFPKFADAIVINNYGKMIKSFLYGEILKEETGNKKRKNSFLNKLAIILVILSFILYGLIFAIPFLPISLYIKAILVPVLVACGEITWWVGVAIVGKQVVTKYRKYLNPLNWFKRKKTHNMGN